jgi:hypothetical protein
MSGPAHDLSRNPMPGYLNQTQPLADGRSVGHDVLMKSYHPYAIRAAMASDQGSSVVYLFDTDMPKEITRAYLRIKPRKGRAVWCEGIINNSNYRKRYNVSGRGRRFIPKEPARAVTMGAWYRSLLRLQRDTQNRLIDTELNIRYFPLNKWSLQRWVGAIRVSQQHPVSPNRIAMNLALLGVALGAISLIIAFK